MDTARGLLLVNPNTSQDMTDALLAQARRHAAPSLQIAAITARFGVPVVADRASFVIAAHAALDAVRAHDDPFGAVLLGCFGDPGLAALREATGRPVIGLAEAPLLAAQERDEPFAIVTMGRRWEAMLREQVVLLGLAPLCRGIHALDATGLDYRRDPAAFAGPLAAMVSGAVDAGARCLIPGGAVLAGTALPVPPGIAVIDCMQAAMAAVQRLA